MAEKRNDVKVIAEMLNIIKKLSSVVEESFEETSIIPVEVEDRIISILTIASDKFTSDDPISKEFDLIFRTSSEDREFLDNIGYLKRLFEEMLEDISKKGKTPWLK